VIPFYSDKPSNKFREFSNFFRLARPYEYVLPAFARRKGFPESVWCSFSEKAIMAVKAALMGDLEAWHNIDAADDPKSVKAFGRGVRNFDDQVWMNHLEDIAFDVVRQKFEADKKCRELLLSTGDAIIAEAAPNDCIWGIGLATSDDRAYHPDQWLGRNVLGYALMKVRELIRGKSAGQATEETEVATVATQEDAKAAAASEAVPVAREENPSRERRKRWGNQVGQSSSIGSGAASSSSGTAAAAALTPAALDPLLQPDASGDNGDIFAVLDFEATCDNGRWEVQEVIEIPLVLVDGASGLKLAEFRTYVRPHHRPQLTAFCTQLTGIQQNTVDEAPSFSKAFAQVQEWLDSELVRLKVTNCIFVTCGDWDLRSMLPQQCSLSGQHVPGRFRRWLNIKKLFEKVMERPGQGMASMLAVLGLKLQGHHHSGLDDSRNIARILQTLLERGRANGSIAGRADIEQLLSSSAQFAPQWKGCSKGNGKSKR
jgi:ribA/ribD-fused uncharacterized protein